MQLLFFVVFLVATTASMLMWSMSQADTKALTRSLAKLVCLLAYYMLFAFLFGALASRSTLSFRDWLLVLVPLTTVADFVYVFLHRYVRRRGSITQLRIDCMLCLSALWIVAGVLLYSF